jgi:hypothetical protein
VRMLHTCVAAEVVDSPLNLKLKDETKPSPTCFLPFDQAEPPRPPKRTIPVLRSKLTSPTNLTSDKRERALSSYTGEAWS